MSRRFRVQDAAPRSRGVWRELVFVSRFGLVGLAATAVHVVIVSVLIVFAKVPVLLANLVAFLIAFSVSFSGNYVWAFGRPRSPRSAMGRFFLVSGGAFCVNTLLLAWLVQTEYLSPAVLAVLAAGAFPLITYLASRFWAFSADGQACSEDDRHGSSCSQKAGAG